MSVTSDKIADTATARAEAVRHLAQAKATHARAIAASTATQARARLRSGSSATRSAAKAAALSMPTGWLIGNRIEAAWKTTRAASDEASKQLQQARAVMRDRVLPAVRPMASSALDRASHQFDEFMTTSAPVRKEALRRGLLAAAALRGAAPVLAKRRRRWPVALTFLALGAVVGAAAAWLSQAGKPVQLSPYPIPAEDDGRNASAETVDLTSDDVAHQES